MNRYVDAEWLIKESMPLSFSVQKWVNEVQIMTAPSVDIAFCKECKELHDSRGDAWEIDVIERGYIGWCNRTSRIGDVDYVKINDFCSYGERKEP